MVPVISLEANPTLLFPASSVFRCSLACGCIIPATSSIFTWLSSSQYVLFVRGPVTGFRVHSNPEWFPHLKSFILITSAKSFFPQKYDHIYRLLGIKTWIHLLGPQFTAPNTFKGWNCGLIIRIFYWLFSFPHLITFFWGSLSKRTPWPLILVIGSILGEAKLKHIDEINYVKTIAQKVWDGKWI